MNQKLFVYQWQWPVASDCSKDQACFLCTGVSSVTSDFSIGQNLLYLQESIQRPVFVTGRAVIVTKASVC